MDGGRKSWGPAGWGCEKSEVVSSAGILAGNGGREWLLSFLYCAPVLGPALTLLLCLFPALMGKGETDLEREHELRRDESGQSGKKEEKRALSMTLCGEGTCSKHSPRVCNLPLALYFTSSSTRTC